MSDIYNNGIDQQVLQDKIVKITDKFDKQLSSLLDSAIKFITKECSSIEQQRQNLTEENQTLKQDQFFLGSFLNKLNSSLDSITETQKNINLKVKNISTNSK